MVALECELPLSGRLSPTADTPMSLPLPSAVSSSSGENDSQPVLAHIPGLPASSGGDRPGLKRKIPPGDEQLDEHQCSQGTHDVHQGRDVTCERCGKTYVEERESKRRRLSHACSGTENNEDVVENASERPQNVLVETVHSDLSVEQTLDIVTTSVNMDLVKTPDSAIGTQLVPLDVVVESSETSLMGDFPNRATQGIPDSIVEVDIVAGGDNPKYSPPSDSYPLPSTIATSPQHSDSFCGDDMLLEEGDDDAFGEICQPRPQRISPFLNTPKQRKEERRKVLRLSIHKMRAVDDPEHFLRRSVLINNTMKRLQRELREEKMRNSSPRRGFYGLYRRSSPFHYDALNHNSYVLSDESFALGDSDRITDDMTDALVTRLEATSSHLVVPTPSPSPCPVVETESCLVDFPMSSSEERPAGSSLSCLSEVTSSVTESMSVMTPEMTSSSFADPCSSLTENLMSSGSEATSLRVESMTSPVSDLTSSVSDITSSVPELTSPNCISSSPFSSSSSTSVSVPCNGTVYDDGFTVTNMVRESQSPSSSCSSESQREKQLYTDIDVVFNNLIHALGDS